MILRSSPQSMSTCCSSCWSSGRPSSSSMIIKLTWRPPRSPFNSWLQELLSELSQLVSFVGCIQFNSILWLNFATQFNEPTKATLFGSIKFNSIDSNSTTTTTTTKVITNNLTYLLLSCSWSWSALCFSSSNRLDLAVRAV